MASSRRQDWRPRPTSTNAAEGESERATVRLPRRISSSYARSASRLDGLLVFFAGIPGCGKSSIAEAVANHPEKLGDGKPITSLMGDRVKGKFYPRLRELRLQNTRVHTIADKNAPNTDVWMQVKNIARASHAIGVPVVPDSPGVRDNPFDLTLLAVFIHRVLQRVHHPGNLDRNSVSPAYVVLKFHSLYRGQFQSSFDRSLIEMFGVLVKYPVIRQGAPSLPGDIIAVIEEGMELLRQLEAAYGRR